MAFNITFLDIRPGAQAAALAKLKSWNERIQLKGRLAGAWYSEIGPLNRILLIHAYDGTGGMAADRDIVFAEPDPYGLGDLLSGFSMDAYSPFPGAETLEPGEFGPYFEVRSYALKPQGLAPTLEAWSKVLDARRSVSPLVTVAYARSGAMPRFLHIWPYRSIDERFALRAEAQRRGIWPPPGGVNHIAEMNSAIYLAADFSPIR